MQSITNKISSIRETLSGSYQKPSTEKVEGFIKDLQESSIAKDYLFVKRGLAEQTIKHFNLGYDKEKNAISIPVYKRGELINIRYRFLDNNDMKYTQEKGCEVWLYNEDGISKGLKKGGVLIVEGEFDLISSWQAGFKNVISPASGKNSYGVWLELLDNIPKVYIAYDNDKPGKSASLKLSERIGVDKCMEVLYPDGIKDANEYFSNFDRTDFIELIKNARPFYKYTFRGVNDILDDMRNKKDNLLKIKLIPYVEFEEDWIAIISGDSNSGKTSYVMNIANELANKGIPTLVMPFERGIKSVGKRFLQIKFDMTNQDFNFVEDSEWNKMISETVNLPLYFSVPNVNEVKDTIEKGKRLFDIKVIIVDHLNYLVRKDNENENVAISKTLMDFKQIAQENNIIFLLVHHINKPVTKSSKPQRPRKEDLKGSSALYQDPEAVIMLYPPDDGKLEVNILKSKGDMGFKIFDFDTKKGIVKENNEVDNTSENIEKVWESL
ncbi:MAG: AAA family ATPase [Planctomycetia bacterium]|nr:AAA family ATPase [Planctomycetia bacterium]